MSQLIRKDVSEAITRLPIADSNETRVAKAVVKGSGTVRITGSNWEHFGSQRLLANGVLEQRDGCLVYGPLFEDYLIAQAMADSHLEYSRQIRSDDATGHADMLDFLPEAFMSEFASASATRRMEMLVYQVVALHEMYSNLEDAVEDSRQALTL
jgi:hypothetical protein